MTTVIDTLTRLGLPAQNLTFEQGLQALNSLSNNGLDQVDRTVLRDLVNRVSADAPGSVTVLYSGDVNTELGLKPLTIINAMQRNGDDIRIIQDSPAAKFLGNDTFKESLAQSLGVDLDKLDLRGTEANDFFEGPQGLWGDVSANFIDATKGDIVTLTGDAANDRIFSQRELERLQANEKITSVDGLDRTHLSNMTQEQAYKAIKAASDTRLADLNIVLDADGKPALYGRQIMIGDDELYGGADNDLLDGGIGNDVLRGGLGINTYIFNRGYGQDTISLGTLTTDTLLTEEHIKLDVLSSEIDLDSLWGTDLLIKIKNSTDQLQITDVFQDNTSFKTLSFSDETVWTIEEIKAQRLVGNDQNNYLTGFDGRENIIYGYAGDDSLTGQAGNDQLYGGEGDDFLTDNGGDDLLDGGLGNDVLNGGLGINTYIFNRGYGEDEIYSIYMDETTPFTETYIKLDVLSSDVEFTTYWGSGLILKLKNSDDQLDIQGAFNEYSAFRSITFADQTVWKIEDIKNQLLIGDELDNSIIGFENRDNILYGFAGDDFLMGQTGDDQLYGGNDSDSLYGGLGNDQLFGEVADDTLMGEDGDDVLNGGLGNDQYVGGTGADIVIYELLVGSDAVGGNGNDNWSDFTVGNTVINVNADKIDISELIIDSIGNYSSSNLEPFIKTVVNGSNTQLYIDRDGSGSMYSSSLFLTLNNINTHLNDLVNNQQIIV